MKEDLIRSHELLHMKVGYIRAAVSGMVLRRYWFPSFVCGTKSLGVHHQRPSILMHILCMRHQVTGRASSAAMDDHT
jgi:hypothetical protein